MDIYNTVNYMRQNHKTIFDLPIRVTYYVRVSTMKEEQDSSVEHQIDHFNRTIKEHDNWTYVEGYVDRVRGESASNRENFMRMIEDGKSGKFDLILTKEVSRFARNTIDSLTYTRELLRNGVGVFFQNDNICTVDSDAEFRLTIMASIAQDEVRKMSERIKFGHKQAIRKGTVMGNSRIYGYDKKDCKLVINEKEAEMVRFIFEQYATGMYAIRAIQRQLVEKGYRSRTGTEISHTTIAAILSNPKYKGYYCGNKVKIADYRTKEQIFLPEEEWIMYKDETGETVPAIVSEELWEQANRIYRQRSEEVKSRGRGQKTTSVLSGKIICMHCNAPFWRTSYSHVLHRDKNIYQFICRDKKKNGSSTCPTFAIYETEIYQILSECFSKSLRQMGEHTDAFIQVCKKAIEESVSQESVDKLLIDKNELERKKEMLLDLYMGGDIDKADFKKRNSQLNDSIAEIDSKYTALSNNVSYKAIEHRLIEIKQVVDDMLNGKEQLSNEEVDILVGMYLKRIEVKAVDKKTLNLKIILDFGEAECDYNRSSGVTVCTMLPELQLHTNRIFGKNIVNYYYNTTISIIINKGE